MPPKTRTPSKESAAENPRLGQVLAMLQSMTAQIDGLSSRMMAAMKKTSEAAEMAAIGGRGNDPKGQRSESFLRAQAP